MNHEIFFNKVIHFKFTLMYFKSFICKLKMLVLFKTAGPIIRIYNTILKLNNDISNLLKHFSQIALVIYLVKF